MRGDVADTGGADERGLGREAALLEAEDDGLDEVFLCAAEGANP